VNLRNQQLKALYEGGASLEDIHSAFPELSMDAIKLCLMGCSVKFRQETRKNQELFGDAEKYAAIINEIVDDPECPHSVKLKACVFAINEQKGRNEVRKMATNITSNLNVTVLNAHLKKVEDVYQKTKNQKVIELKPEEVELLRAE